MWQPFKKKNRVSPDFTSASMFTSFLMRFPVPLFLNCQTGSPGKCPGLHGPRSSPGRAPNLFRFPSARREPRPHRHHPWPKAIRPPESVSKCAHKSHSIEICVCKCIFKYIYHIHICVYICVCVHFHFCTYMIYTVHDTPNPVTGKKFLPQMFQAGLRGQDQAICFRPQERLALTAFNKDWTGGKWSQFMSKKRTNVNMCQKNGTEIFFDERRLFNQTFPHTHMTNGNSSSYPQWRNSI